ncbi:MAG TPA: cation diffusion facilitator family transporter [Actinocrinis sp.]|nr:cation diffusion facilitator family transporter [Actinocrinis sp.]
MTPVSTGERSEPAGAERGPPTANTVPVTAAQAFTSRRSVTVGMVVAIIQTVALAVAAAVTGSAALKTQTATNLADVAVGAFLLIAVVSSSRPADSTHPLGYGRERFFWSFVAAVGIFVGGVGAAVVETLQAAFHPQPAGAYAVGYGVLAVIVLLDAFALTVGLRPLRQNAHERNVPLARFLWRSTDPAVTTLVLSSAAGLAGGLVAAAGLAGREATGSPATDAAASALIGLILLATSLVLLHTNRELLTGRAVSPAQADAMRRLIGDQPGVVAVPDLFAIVIGPSSLIVDADVVFDDDLNVPEVEEAIVPAAAALRTCWPTVAYVYLNPVAQHRHRRFTPTPKTAPTRTRTAPRPRWRRQVDPGIRRATGRPVRFSATRLLGGPDTPGTCAGCACTVAGHDTGAYWC